MKAAVLYGRHDLRYEEVSTPSIANDEVLVRVYACSICGSDLHAYEGNHPRVVFPRILGHEFAGTIEALGEDVKNVQIGQRVCCDIDLSCGQCGPCLEGRGNICEKLKTLGFDRDGAYAEFVAVPAANIYPLPDNVTFDEASMVQTIGIGYHAVAHRAKVEPGEKVAVIGAGPIGLGAACVAKALGAWVVIFDLLDYRLETAKKVGIDAVINSHQEDLKDRVASLTNNRGFDKVLECVGGKQEKTIVTALDIVKRGGKVIIVGTFPENKATIPIAWFKDREMELIGSRGNFQAFAPCLDLIAKGLIKPTYFISHTFPLSRAEEGFHLMEEKTASVFKVVLHPQENI